MRCNESLEVEPRKYDAEALVIRKDFMRPVCGICGPTQRSIIGPHR